MEKRIKERESAKLFWTRYRDDCLPIRSVKEVFQKYKVFTEENQYPLLNEFIFRTFIRKNGYCNTVAEQDLEKVAEKKRRKKEARAERKKLKKLHKSFDVKQNVEADE